MSNITLTPAYGRDYKSGKAAKEDYNNGVDFILNAWGNPYDGKPINKEQVDQAGLNVSLRFNKLTKVCGVHS